MEFKRYIFLDVDGVLNHPAYYDYLYENFDQRTIDQMELLTSNCDPEKLKLLNQLEGCKVVMITSWDHDRCMKALPVLGLKLPIIGGVTPRELQHKWLVRGNSIAEWFVDHFGDMPRDSFCNSFEEDGWWHPDRRYSRINGKTIVSTSGVLAVTYVIFDDTADMLLDQVNHFIHVDHRKGLTENDIEKAKKILNL